MLTLYDFGTQYAARRCGLRCAPKVLIGSQSRSTCLRLTKYDPKYLKLNPKGVVPTLVHDGKAVIEFTLICEYIDETFPQAPQLIPADPMAPKPHAAVEQDG